jgi:hypothetical protein
MVGSQEGREPLFFCASFDCANSSIGTMQLDERFMLRPGAARRWAETVFLGNLGEAAPSGRP